MSSPTSLHFHQGVLMTQNRTRFEIFSLSGAPPFYWRLTLVSETNPGTTLAQSAIGFPSPQDAIDNLRRLAMSFQLADIVVLQFQET